MGRLVDLTGVRFGRLTVVGRCESNKSRHISWDCVCDCGSGVTVFGDNLNRGHTKSCGCLRVDTSRTHGMYGTRTYRTWNMMKQRCTNPGNTSYKSYGGRGIKICDKWLTSFEDFHKDMGDRPEGMSLDRVDNNGGYCKENCKWSTPKEQASNRRMQSNNKSGVTGVSWDNSYGRWVASYKGKFLVGTDSFEEACRVRSEAEGGGGICSL
jgi:hypothetical protein